MLKQALFWLKIEVRRDSALFSDAIVSLLDEMGIEFTLSVPFERFVELKRGIQGRGRWRSMDETWSFFEWERREVRGERQKVQGSRIRNKNAASTYEEERNRIELGGRDLKPFNRDNGLDLFEFSIPAKDRSLISECRSCGKAIGIRNSIFSLDFRSLPNEFAIGENDGERES